MNSSYGTRGSPFAVDSQTSFAGSGGKTYSDRELIETFRKKLSSRGASGILGLQRTFKIVDDDGSKSLNANEFKKCIKDMRLAFTENDAGRLFNIFDRDRSGIVSYDEFLRIIRGDMNQFRRNYVKKAYAILDKDGSGVVEVSDIRGKTQATKKTD